MKAKRRPGRTMLGLEDEEFKAFAGKCNKLSSSLRPVRWKEKIDS